MDYRIIDPKASSGAGAKAPASEQDIFDALLSGKTIEATKETSRGTFTAKYPSGKDRLRTDQLRAYRRNGLSESAFDDRATWNNEVWTLLDICIISGPEWYRAIKSDNPNWTWEDCPDEQLTVELYRWVYSFREQIQAAIRESGPRGVTAVSPPVEPPKAMADGAFSGLANRPTSR